MNAKRYEDIRGGGIPERSTIYERPKGAPKEVETIFKVKFYDRSPQCS